MVFLTLLTVKLIIETQMRNVQKQNFYVYSNSSSMFYLLFIKVELEIYFKIVV